MYFNQPPKSSWISRQLRAGRSVEACVQAQGRSDELILSDMDDSKSKKSIVKM